jgi:hypothetical protein
MNTYLLVSAGLAAFMLVGHSTIGRKQFFLPMVAADFDPVAKRVMEFVWHMSTAALFLPPFALAYAASDAAIATELRPLVLFLALQYGAIGVIHLTVAATSGIAGAPLKLFQWSLFLVVGATAWLGL